MPDKKKDPLDINDLPDEGKGSEKVKGGFAPTKPTMKMDCNTNTLTCKDTSTTNTFCCP